MNTDHIDKYVKLGSRDKNWFQECEDTLIEIFGPSELQIVVKILAATSINTSLKGNITLFKRAYNEYLNDLPISNYLPNIQDQLQRVREGKELSGRKINSFARAMSGDPHAVVVDVWLLRAFGRSRKYFRTKSGRMQEGGASKKDYDLIESYVREKARKKGLQAREMSAMIWSGVRIDQGGDTQTRYTDILKEDYINSLFPYENS